MKTTVVYFNQWFSSISWVIKDLKHRMNNIYVIASSKNPDHVYKKYVDEFIIEDWDDTSDKAFAMANYIMWLKAFCTEHCVDIFFVKKYMNEVAYYKDQFEEIGVKLICEDEHLINTCCNKAQVYKLLSTFQPLRKYIPEYHHYGSSDLTYVLEYIIEHRDKNNICFKYNSDEGGQSYRAIDDRALTVRSLNSYRMNTLTTDDALRLISNSSSEVNKLIFMEKLDEPEISVDCYNSKRGFIAICRSKGEGRTEKVYFNEQIYNICESICNFFNFKYPFNVQFRYKHTKNYEKTGKHSARDLRLLEINPRMSGGLYYEVCAGLNLAYLCLSDNLSDKPRYHDINAYLDFEPKTITHLEMPISLDDDKKY